MASRRFILGNFFSPQKFPKKIWESRKHQHQNGVALWVHSVLCNQGVEVRTQDASFVFLYIYIIITLVS
jgi:hypothetical protein